MGETKKRSIRVSDEVWERLNALPGTVDESLAGLLSDNVRQAQPVSEDHRIDEVLELVRSMAGAQVNAEEIETIIESVMDRKIAARAQAGAGYGSGAMNHCAHCDQDYPRPAGQPSTSMCPTCRAAGHWNTGNCRPCAEANHLASVAARDQTGADRSDIVYDAQT